MLTTTKFIILLLKSSSPRIPCPQRKEKVLYTLSPIDNNAKTNNDNNKNKIIFKKGVLSILRSPFIIERIQIDLLIFLLNRNINRLSRDLWLIFIIIILLLLIFFLLLLSIRALDPLGPQVGPPVAVAAQNFSIPRRNLVIAIAVLGRLAFEIQLVLEVGRHGAALAGLLVPVKTIYALPVLLGAFARLDIGHTVVFLGIETFCGAFSVKLKYYYWCWLLLLYYFFWVLEKSFFGELNNKFFLRNFLVVKLFLASFLFF